jgi:hypothetical protein
MRAFVFVVNLSKPRDIFILGNDDADTLSWAQHLTDVFGGAILTSNKKMGGSGALSIPNKLRSNAAGFMSEVAAPMAAIIANDVSAAVSRVRSGTLGNRSDSSESGVNSNNSGVYSSGSNASGTIGGSISKSRSIDATDDRLVDETVSVDSTPTPAPVGIDLRNISPALAYRSPSRLVSGSPVAGGSAGGASGSGSSSSKVERVLQQSDAALLDAVNLANEFQFSDDENDEDGGEGEVAILPVEE